MKILHTADWHIGKVLHKQSLQDEMDLFLDWLLKLLESECIDLLLVSGDIFDVANPAVKDRKVYYNFLSKLIGSKTQVIITGGNHDSIALLDAPQEILEHINISVVGGARENLEDEIIEVKGSDGSLELVVAAVPFLRDKDLRSSVESAEGKDRSAVLKEGIANHYSKVGALCSEKYKDKPAIAMGHLYAKGVSTSDSERDIHIGNAAAVESDIFPPAFGYVALGHIHRPQMIGGSDMIRYSGSPIALSFSEKTDTKCVLILELKDNKFSAPRVVDIPKKRALTKFAGPFDEVRSKLENYNPEYDLVSFVEIEVIEGDFSSTALANVEDLVTEYASHDRFHILKSRTQFKNGANDTSDLFDQGVNIEDLRPSEVFEKRLLTEQIDDDKRSFLETAFQEILEEVLQKG
ncbi:MAG: exonuclease SbcD [Saprospiraceae bacterium]|jgi:exonuclease SbcD